jgi:hypothetical protein
MISKQMLYSIGMRNNTINATDTLPSDGNGAPDHLSTVPGAIQLVTVSSTPFYRHG